MDNVHTLSLISIRIVLNILFSIGLTRIRVNEAHKFALEKEGSFDFFNYNLVKNISLLPDAQGLSAKSSLKNAGLF